MFKIGDLARYKSDGEICEVVGYGDLPGEYRVKTKRRGIHTESLNYIEPISTGPVRELVPGTYGKVRIYDRLDNTSWIKVESAMTAEELREAAHIFNQIAEVLEDV